jgi:hypothetical protein
MGIPKHSKTRFVIASEAKQSRVFAKDYGRLPRRYAPRNDIEAVFRGSPISIPAAPNEAAAVV